MDCNQTGPQQCDTREQNAKCAVREPTFREVLENQIYELQARLESLRSLSRALPAELPHSADRAMRELLSYA